jgi:hypothetical protein
MRMYFTQGRVEHWLIGLGLTNALAFWRRRILCQEKKERQGHNNEQYWHWQNKIRPETRPIRP